eukprot:scaffold1490_cov162-Ochromonas_danica.AAC.15
MNLGTLYLSYLHSLFELQVDLTDYLPPQSSADSVELPVASEAAELPPDNKNNRELIAPEDVLDLADSQSRDLFSSRSQSTYSVLSSPANRASLFRTRSSAPSIASSGPRTSTQHHSEVSLHQADSNPSMTSTLFKQNSNQKLPRYMMHSKSFSNKVKTKHSNAYWEKGQIRLPWGQKTKTPKGVARYFPSTLSIHGLGNTQTMGLEEGMGIM